jgi:NAD+ kinase
MKVLIYVNKAKDVDGIWTKNFTTILEKEGILYDFFENGNLSFDYDCAFVLGGDGTILGLVDYLSEHDIPVVGINAGKLGFLTEFEREETENAVKLFKSGKLITDYRDTIAMELNGKLYRALNDVVVQRVYDHEEESIVINMSVSVDGKIIDKISGDGIIVSTPTGSTAYSLSAGGSILAPGINAFCITPICAHSLNLRPVVYSADLVSEIKCITGNKAGVYVDGKFAGYLSPGQKILIKKDKKSVAFLRNEDFDFFVRLNKKFKFEKVM